MNSHNISYFNIKFISFSFFLCLSVCLSLSYQYYILIYKAKTNKKIRIVCNDKNFGTYKHDIL